ncbi:hypothetical protein OUY22_13795 [Nonomuraea sp. MCN248]|uniref:Beta-lactamase family protein n=1 Tax=Nonomuraea corallina TaxID=2989783 RepID=A0ABT4SBA1_9ACTN|nr:hypothetical protein [Nonomuraea corallina]MDA0634493.1 hypothetical protein [Nonomuraea corallina]
MPAEAVLPGFDRMTGGLPPVAAMVAASPPGTKLTHSSGGWGATLIGRDGARRVHGLGVAA